MSSAVCPIFVSFLRGAECPAGSLSNLFLSFVRVVDVSSLRQRSVRERHNGKCCASTYFDCYGDGPSPVGSSGCKPPPVESLSGRMTAYARQRRLAVFWIRSTGHPDCLLTTSSTRVASVVAGTALRLQRQLLEGRMGVRTAGHRRWQRDRRPLRRVRRDTQPSAFETSTDRAVRPDEEPGDAEQDEPHPPIGVGTHVEVTSVGRSASATSSDLPSCHGFARA
jgi:hypothetical protein